MGALSMVGVRLPASVAALSALAGCLGFPWMADPPVPSGWQPRWRAGPSSSDEFSCSFLVVAHRRSTNMNGACLSAEISLCGSLDAGTSARVMGREDCVGTSFLRWPSHAEKDSRADAPLRRRLPSRAD